MNGLCSACKKPVEVVDFRLSEGLVIVRCPACGKQQRLSLSEAGGADALAEVPAPVPAAARPQAPPPSVRLSPQPSARAIEPLFEPPAGFCQKCVTLRTPGGKSCPACGLVFANATAPEMKASEGLVAAWKALAARWGEAAEHTRFLHLAEASGELAMAGRLYRIRLAQAPADAAARASLDATVKLASAAVSVAAIKSAKAPEEAPGRRKKLILMAIMFLGPGLLLAVFKLFGGGH